MTSITPKVGLTQNLGPEPGETSSRVGKLAVKLVPRVSKIGKMLGFDLIDRSLITQL